MESKTVKVHISPLQAKKNTESGKMASAQDGSAGASKTDLVNRNEYD